MRQNSILLGAIAGDTIGSIYEFRSIKDYNFTLLHDSMEYTDDSIMTLAVADWILSDETLSHEALVDKLQHWGCTYPTPKGHYGCSFSAWLHNKDPRPYNSWGNGAAMRVSAVGSAFNSLEETIEIAKRSAEVTHNHPEGIKGAQATAAAIFLARTGKTKDEIRECICSRFGYDLNRTCEEIRKTYGFNDSCQETVPESIIAFLESKDYEDAIRLTISLGGDADTMGAITGAIAGAFYNEIPDHIYSFASSKLPDDLKNIAIRFANRFKTV